MLGVEELGVVFAGHSGTDHLWRKVDRGLVDKRPFSRLAGCLGLWGLHQTGADGSGNEPGNEQSGEEQKSAYQEALVHWEVSPSEPDLPEVESLLKRGITIL